MNQLSLVRQEKLFQKVKPMLRYAADRYWFRFSKDRPDGVEEAFAEASLMFVQCVRSFNPDMGVSFSTYLARCLDHLGNTSPKIRRQNTARKEREVFVENIEDVASVDGPQALKFGLSLHRKLKSRASCQAVRMCLDGKALFLGELRELLLSNGYSRKEISMAIKEIKKALQED